MSGGTSEIRELIEMACEGALTRPQLQRLESLLLGNEEAQWMYLAYTRLDARLRWDYGEVAVLPPPVLGQGGGGSADSSAPDAASAAPFPGFLGNLLPRGENLPGMKMFVWMLAGFVGMLLGLSTILAILAALGFINQPAAQLVAATDCRWTNPAASLLAGSDLRPGQRIDLAAGEAQIAFRRGALVTLFGPGVLEIQSESSARLLVGKLTARAETKKSHGFRVRTPTMTLIDLGTEFNVVVSEDGRSQIHVVAGEVEVRLADGRAQRRLGVGQSVEVNAARPSVFARIEPGDGTAAFKFPTIEPPSRDDYADASQGHAHIRVLRGTPYFARASNSPTGMVKSGPAEVLLDGKGQSKPDAPEESFFFADRTSGMILLDLGQTIPVKKVNTYSWHKSQWSSRDHVRATQKYYLYGAPHATPPGADGNLATAGWTLIAQVNTDEFFGFPHAAARPTQQAVSITTADGGPIGEYRYLLWDVRPTRSERSRELADNTFYGEFDVYRSGD